MLQILRVAWHVRRLHSQKPALRIAAAAALGHLPCVPAVTALVGSLRDDLREVRLAAATALGCIGDARAIEPLVAALGDADFNVRTAIERSLQRFGKDLLAGPLLAAVTGGKATLAVAAIKIAVPLLGTDAVDPLVRALGDALAPVRRAAADALGSIGDARAVAPLVTALGDDDVQVRALAKLALAKFAPDVVIDPMLVAVKQGRPAVRLVACQWLAEHAPTQAIRSAVDALNDDDVRVRCAAATLLGDHFDPQSIAPLVRCLDDKEQAVRDTAERSLRQCPVAALAAPMLAAIENGQPHARLVAAKWASKAGERALEPLTRALTDPDESVRVAAAVGLGEIGAVAAIGALVQAVADISPMVRSTAESALQRFSPDQLSAPMLQAAARGSGGVKIYALKHLGSLPGSGAIKTLQMALVDPDPRVRSAAAEALQVVLASDRRGPVVGDEQPAATVASAVDALIRALDDKETAVRCAVAHALGTAGDPRAVEPLAQGLAAQPPTAASAMLLALERIAKATTLDPAAQAMVTAALAAYDAKKQAANIQDKLREAAQSSSPRSSGTSNRSTMAPEPQDLRVRFDRPLGVLAQFGLQGVLFDVPDAAKALIAALADKDPNVRSAAAKEIASLLRSSSPRSSGSSDRAMMSG